MRSYNPKSPAELQRQLKKTEVDLLAVAREAAKQTAFDVRKAAQRLIKAGGKSPTSKNYRVSRPGEPPVSHSGALKRSIRVEEVKGETNPTFLIGAPSFGSDSTAAATLERGGVGKRTTTTLTLDYFKRRFGGRRKKGGAGRLKERPTGAPGETPGKVPKTKKPAATRPYRVYAPNKPNGKLVREYLYFGSRGKWESARRSSGFQAWARRVRTTATLRFPVEARPFMEPAYRQEAAKEKVDKRLWRLIKRTQK